MANGNRSSEFPSGRLHPFARALLLVIIGALLASSLLCIALGLLTPVELKARLDAMSPHGSAEAFPVARVAVMRWRTLFAGVLALAMAAALWAGRWRFQAGCRHTGATLRCAYDWAIREGRPIAPQLAAVTALGCILRASFLGQAVRVDEATSYLEFISKPLLYGISYYPAPNNHILHTILAHCAALLFGGEPWSFRLAAFLAGTLMIPAAALAAIAIKGRNAALPAAALLAVSWPWVFYSANARGYTIAGLIFLLLIPICVRLRTGRDWGAWVWFVILAGLGLFTVPVMAYALVPLGLWIVVSRPAAWRELAIATACTLVLALLLYAPAFAVSGFTTARTPQMTPPADPARLLRITQFASALWNTWSRDLPQWVLAALVCAAVIGWRSAALAAIALAWFVAALSIYPVMPYTRVWLWLSLPLLLLVASGLAAVLPRPRITAFLMIALVGWQAVRISESGSIPQSKETGAFADAGGVALFLKQHWQPGDGVKVDRVIWPLLYELQREGLPAPGKSAARYWMVTSYPPPAAADPLVQMSECWIWLPPPGSGSARP